MQFRKGFEQVELDFLKAFSFLESYGFELTKKRIEPHLVFFQYEDRKNNFVVHLLYEFMEQVFDFSIFNKENSIKSIPLWKKLIEVDPCFDRKKITPGLNNYHVALSEYAQDLNKLFDLIYLKGRTDLLP